MTCLPCHANQRELYLQYAIDKGRVVSQARRSPNEAGAFERIYSLNAKTAVIVNYQGSAEQYELRLHHARSY